MVREDMYINARTFLDTVRTFTAVNMCVAYLPNSENQLEKGREEL